MNLSYVTEPPTAGSNLNLGGGQLFFLDIPPLIKALPKAQSGCPSTVSVLGFEA